MIYDIRFVLAASADLYNTGRGLFGVVAGGGGRQVSQCTSAPALKNPKRNRSTQVCHERRPILYKMHNIGSKLLYS